MHAQVWRTQRWMTHFGAFAVGGTPYKQTHLVEAEAVIGVTGAPGQEAPQLMDKQIASCGDPSIHETGDDVLHRWHERLDAAVRVAGMAGARGDDRGAGGWRTCR